MYWYGPEVPPFFEWSPSQKIKSLLGHTSYISLVDRVICWHQKCTYAHTRVPLALNELSLTHSLGKGCFITFQRSFEVCASLVQRYNTVDEDAGYCDEKRWESYPITTGCLLSRPFQFKRLFERVFMQGTLPD